MLDINGLERHCQSNIQPELVSSTHNGVTAIMLGLCASFISVTNLLVLSGLLKTRQWKVKSNRFYLFLAFSDMLIGCVSIPLIITALLEPKFLKQSGCSFSVVMNFFSIFPTIMSAVTVWLIAVDRYFAILQKQTHLRYGTTRSISLVLCLNVLLALCWSLLHHAFLKHDDYGQGVSLIALGMLKAFIFVSISFINYRLLKHARVTAKLTRQSFNSISIPPVYDQVMAKICLFISTSLVICYLPSTIANCYEAVLKISGKNIERTDLRTLHVLEIWTILVMYTNGALNGLLFFYRNRKIRRWWRQFYKKLPCFNTGPSTSPRRDRRDAMVFDHSQSMHIHKVVFATANSV